MDRKTLTALKGSIRKWEAIVAGTGADKGVDNCPLCKLFYFGNSVDKRCIRCPVAQRTHSTGCNQSPYNIWASVASFEGRADTPARKYAARKELAFLKSLLPGAKP